MLCSVTRINLIYIIVIKVERLWNPSYSFVICFRSLFRTWPCTTFNSIPIILHLLTKINMALIYIFQSQFVNIKTKNCVRSRSFQHKLQHLCFHLWCLPAFLTVSSTNFVYIYGCIRFAITSVFPKARPALNRTKLRSGATLISLGK